MTITIAFEGADQAECIEKMQGFLRTYHGADGVRKGETPATEAEQPKEKPAPKTRTKAKPKADEAEKEPEEEVPDPDAKFEKGTVTKGGKGKSKIDFDDVTAAAGELIKACGGDMKRAQELVYSEFGVRKVSKLSVEQYGHAHKWMLEIAEQMDESGGE